ncbi:MAG: hypothetical protein K2K97_07365, partial [Muribaculaceae bacterium]|nr:hypothetical protein [Muribaculaceae bacterium]
MRKIFTAIVAAIITLTVLNISAQKISHPSLLFTPERVASAKKSLQTDTVMQNAWKSIKATADAQLEGRPDIMK